MQLDVLHNSTIEPELALIIPQVGYFLLQVRELDLTFDTCTIPKVGDARFYIMNDINLRFNVGSPFVFFTPLRHFLEREVNLVNSRRASAHTYAHVYFLFFHYFRLEENDV